MAGKVLQINFKFSVTASDYEELASSLAQAFAEVPGLVWKIWIINEAESEAGGIYYFDGAESLQQFLTSQLAADVQAHPAVSEFSARPFEVMDAATAMTRGPVEGALAV
jgi:hypothetical protein